MNQAFAIFIEAFLTRLLPIYHEVTLGAVKALQPQSYPAMAAIAGGGALPASAVLYGIGVLLRRMPEKVSTEEQQVRIKKMQGAAKGWLPWLLILSPTPVGGILIIAASFFRLSPLVIVLAILSAEVLWRISPML
jgi:membrane protein YqaA with SNARE-associated domain